jgi:hypothetical protein
MEEATEWLLRFSEGEVDCAAREELHYWLRTSPEHVRRDTGERPNPQELVRIFAANGSLKVLAALPYSVDRFRYFVVDLGAPHFTYAPGFLTIYAGVGFAKVPPEGGGFEPLLKI